MLTRNDRPGHVVCLACLCVFVCAPMILAQDKSSPPPETPPPAAKAAPADTPPAKAAETPPAEPTPQPPAVKPRPKPAEVAPQEPAAKAPRKSRAANRAVRPPKAGGKVKEPAFDYTRLAHPSVADQLELTDEQRAAVAQLVNQRAAALAKASPVERAAIIRASDQKLIALLNEGQQAQLATLAATQKLRFNFRFQKWEDVLDWFARQAGLALVMDQPPSGAFTYSDNRDYTPTEGIDLLNSVLLTKGLTLVKRGRMLILVNLTEDLPLNLIPRVAPEEIPNHGNFEIISVIFPLGRRPADSVVKEIQPLLGKYGTCVGLPQTGQLLVRETAGKMQAISILVSSIPEPPLPKKPEPPKPKEKPVPPVLGVYPVTAIDPHAAVETLGQLFQRAKFTVDDRVDQILVYAPPGDQTAIKEALEKMEANRPADKRARLEIYPIDTAETEQLVAQLEKVVPNSQVTVDATLGHLLVFGEPEDQDKVSEILKKLGAVTEQGSRQVAVYQPKQFAPESLVALIQQMDPRAEVSADEKLRRVVVSASAATQAMVKSLVEQLDQQAAMPDQPKLQVYPLSHVLDATVTTTLGSLVPEAQVTLAADGRQLLVVAREVDQTVIKAMVDQWERAAAAQEKPALKVYPLATELTAADVATLQSLVPDATVTLATDGRQLSVVARAEEQTKVESLVAELQKAASAQEKPALKIYPLDTELAAPDVTTLQSLVPGAQVTLSPDGRQLSVVARAEEQTKIEALITELQKAVAAQGQAELKIYPLQKPLPPTVLSTIQTLVPKAQVSVSSDSKGLIVVARSDDHATFKTMLDQVEASLEAGQQQLETYEIEGMTAAQLQTLLQPLAVTSTITIDTNLDRLIVWGPADEQAAFAAVVDKLSRDPLAGTKPQLQFYPLDDASLSQNAITLLGTLAPAATVTWDAEGRRLMVIAPPKDQEIVRQTIDELTRNAPPAEKQTLQLYTLNSTQRARFEAVQEDVTKDYPGMRVIKDPQTGELAIWAKASQHEKLAELFEQLKATGPAVQKPLLIGYAVKQGSAKAIFEVLQEMYSDIKFTLDEKADRVIAFAPLDQQGLIKQSIAQLDVEARPGSEEQLRSYAVEAGDATTLLPMLESLVPDMKLQAERKGRKIIAWGSVRDHETLAKAVKQFLEGDPDQRPTVKVYTIEGRDAKGLVQLQSVLSQIAPDAVLAVDAKGGGIVASASEEDHQKLQAAVEQVTKMDRLASQQLETYMLKRVRAAQAIETLQSVAPEARITSGAVAEQIVVWATPEDQELIKAALQKLEDTAGMEGKRELKVHRVKLAVSGRIATIIAAALPELQLISGEGTEKLLVWGSPEGHKRMDDVIQQLESEMQADVPKEMRVYELDDVSPTEARRILDASVAELDYVDTPATDRLVIRADAAAHEKVGTVLEELKKVAAQPEQVIKVHQFDIEKFNVSEVYGALDAEVTKDLSIQVNTVTNSLIVRGPAKRQEVLSKAIEELLKELPAAEKRIAQIYRLDRADPSSVSLVLTSLLPTATIAVDVRNQTVAVTATAKEHEQIKKIVDDLDHREDGELSTRTYVLKKAYPPAVVTALTPIVPRATISSDVTNKMLIVTATEKEHEQIQAVIEQADKRGDEDLITKAYPLQWANASTIATALVPIVPNATISPDVYNKTLIVTASDKDHQRVTAVLEQADKRGGGELTTKAYSLKWANPSTISLALRAVVPDATVSSDTINKMLIVTASQTDHDKIQSVLDQADKRGGGDLVTKAYVLNLANPSTIMVALRPVVPDATVSADTINKMLIVTASEEDHQRIQAIVDEADHRGEGELSTVVYSLQWANATAIMTALKPIAPNAVVSPDIYNKTLIVTATAADHERIKAVVDQADKRAGGDLLTKAYSLKWANPSTISLALRAVVPDATVSSDTINKMLIVTASQADHDKIQTVLDQADKRGGGDLVTKAYVLNLANPSTIMVALRPVVPDATVSADTTNKMLIVTASEEDHKRIQAIVDEADRRGEGDLTTVVYSLQWANPTAISLSLRPIAPNAVVSPDIYNKTLIVTASAQDHERIKAVVEQADKRGGGDLLTKAYPLKRANPTTMSRALASVVPDATVSSDTLNKMLIVTASQADHDKIQAVLDQADQRGGGTLVTKAYVLQLANPSTIMLALRPVVPDATISSDPTNNMLIVTATEEDHKQIQSIVDEADRRSEGDLTTVVYSLKWANPTAISLSLRPIAPNATVSPDIYNKTLIVTASAKDHERIKAVVEQADKRGGGDLLTKAYALKWADPSTISLALQAVVPDATVSSDRTNKMLIVTASQEDHDRIQAVLDQADNRGGGDLTTKAYALTRASATTMMIALQPVVPDATISADKVNNVLIATATQEDQLRIKTIVDEADHRNEGELITEAYPLKWANPKTIALALAPIVPNATVASDTLNKTLIVTASAKDHERVKKVVDQADRHGEGEMTTEVYLLTRASPTSVARALQPLVPTAIIGSDVTSKTLIVTAPAEDQAQIKTIVEQADRRGEGELETKVYAFRLASPVTVAKALTPLIPGATMSGDPTTNTLIVTATAKDHAQIEPLVAQLDVADPSSGVLQTYQIENGNAQDVYDALRSLYRYNRTVSIGVQEKTGTILVVAPAIDQEHVGQAIADIQKMTAGRPESTLEVYTLGDMDGSTALSALESLFENKTPKVELEYDFSNNQVLAVAEPEQHDMIRKALDQLKPREREVEVFTLRQVDPYTAQSAIDTLFEDLPLAATPSVEIDPGTQQLFVRAEKPQIDRIRELLEKMGEGPNQARTSAGSMMRILPLSGDSMEMLEQIQRVWPRLRGNPIQVVTPPGQPSGDTKAGPKPPANSPPNKGASNARESNANREISSSDRPPAGDAIGLAALPWMLVGAGAQTQTPTTQPDAGNQQPASDKTAPVKQPAPGESVKQAAPAAGEKLLAPILVIPGPGRITIASQDKEALDQFQSLLEAMQHRQRLTVTTGNFSMFLLQNGNATEVARTLNDLFRQGSRSSSSRYSSSYRSSSRRRMSTLNVVADERMNALLVYGTPAEREVVEKMLDVLDSPETPELFSTEKPRMIPVKNLPASTVMDVLSSVYKTHLTARRGIKPVPIPQGIDPQMTAMLQLLNATANAPLLTLDVDENTNSIVMRAPLQLGEEVEEFVKELDEQAKEGGTQNISMIQLKGLNSEQVEQALRMLRSSRGSSRSSGYSGRSSGYSSRSSRSSRSR